MGAERAALDALYELLDQDNPPTFIHIFDQELTYSELRNNPTQYNTTVAKSRLGVFFGATKGNRPRLRDNCSIYPIQATAAADDAGHLLRSAVLGDFAAYVTSLGRVNLVSEIRGAVEAEEIADMIAAIRPRQRWNRTRVEQHLRDLYQDPAIRLRRT